MQDTLIQVQDSLAQTLPEINSLSDVTDYAKELFLQNQFFQGTAVAGAIAGAATGVIMYGKRVYSWVLRRAKRRVMYYVEVDDTSDLYKAVTFFMNRNRKGSMRNVSARLSTKSVEDEWLRAGDRPARSEETENREVELSQKSETFSFKHKGKRLFIVKRREKLEGSRDSRNAYRDFYVFSSIISKETIHRFLDDCVTQYLSYLKNRITPEILASDGYRGWDKISDLNPRTIDTVHYRNVQDLKNDFDNFLTSKDRYTRYGITYKRNYLLYGPPGNGKTSMIRALAYHYKRDLYMLNVADTISDRALQSQLLSVKPNSIVVIEDIDAALGNLDRKEDKSKDGSKDQLKLSSLLNVLDGVTTKSGIVFFLTTNYPERLDSALTRSGRIDRKFEFPDPSKEESEAYVSTFFPSEEVSIPAGFSYADLQEACFNSESFAEAKRKLGL